MDLQSGKWKVELEMQTDWDARSVEARFEIKAGEKIILSAETVTDVGRPVIYRQSEVEGRPRAWLFESSAEHVKDTIKAGR